MTSLHVATAQVHSGGTPQENLARIEAQVRAAASVGVQVILFAESAIHGYDYDMTAEQISSLAEPVDGASGQTVARFARENNITVIAGFYERDDDAIYNSHMVVGPDGLIGVQRKHQLTQGELDAGLCQGPEERTVFELYGIRTAILICADTGIGDIHEKLGAQNVQLYFQPTGGGGKMHEMLHAADLADLEKQAYYSDKRKTVFWDEAILPTEKCPGVAFAAANALGPVGEQTCHQGHCMIVDSQRVMRAQIPGTCILEHQQDQMIHACLEF